MRRLVAREGEVTDRATSPRGTAHVASPACAGSGGKWIPHARTSAVVHPQLLASPPSTFFTTHHLRVFNLPLNT